MESNITYTLIIGIFTNNLWYGICFTLVIVICVHCVIYWKCMTHAFCVTTSNVLLHMVSSSVFFLLSLFLICIKKIKIWGNLSRMDCIQIWLQLSVTWFIICRTPDPDPLLFSDFNSDESSNMKFCMVGSSYHWVIYFICLGRVVLPRLQHEDFSFRMDNTKRIYVTCVAIIQIQPSEYFPPIPKNIPVCQLFTFHIILTHSG